MNPGMSAPSPDDRIRIVEEAIEELRVKMGKLLADEAVGGVMKGPFRLPLPAIRSFAVADLPTPIGNNGIAWASDGRKLLSGACGEISAEDANDTITITSALEANKVQIDTFDTNGKAYLATPDHTSAHITITVPGDYFITCHVTTDSLAGSAARFGFGVFINNGGTHFHNLHTHLDVAAGAGGNADSIGMEGLVTLAAADTVEVWVWNEDNTQNIVVDDITLSLFQVNGIGEMAGAGTGTLTYYDGVAWRRVGDGKTVAA